MPDPRLDQLGLRLLNRNAFLPTTMEFGHRRSGKRRVQRRRVGQPVLTNIRKTEAIGHVVRRFENDNIIHVAGKVTGRRYMLSIPNWRAG